MEGKDKNQICPLIGDDLLVGIQIELLGWRGGEELMILGKLEHGLVPEIELLIPEKGIVGQRPLATSVLVAPVVAESREVYPLWMPKFIADKVQVALAS